MTKPSGRRVKVRSKTKQRDLRNVNCRSLVGLGQLWTCVGFSGGVVSNSDLSSISMFW